ncbi:CobW family GTP-binding protein [Alcaligenes faecalis]|uniref:CobW family GTP-binding protein n=1 Tax=Alcaligenes faecalis TaxID=511 RepID=UPI00214FF1EC|nr:GTP-binding protein [Alcaligenes faecalis]MCR4144438.1 GTP-binding protein [Alcaligenes faecalis]
MPKSAQGPIPVTLLTGFLGSGKTTLINRALKEAQMADTLVIINEFGQTALDHHLVAHSQENVIEAMGSGCLCCTIRRDLVQTLRDITWRFSRAGQRQFRRVLIETTGLANPAPILHTLLSDPQLAGKYSLAGVVTVVDLEHGLETLARHAEARRQIAVADLLLFSKRDRVDAGAETALLEYVRGLNPLAQQQILSAAQTVAPSLLGLGEQAGQGRAWSLEAFEALGQDTGDHDHDHDHDQVHSHSQATGTMAGNGNGNGNGNADRLESVHLHGASSNESAVGQPDVSRHGDSIYSLSALFPQALPADKLQSWLSELCQWAGPRLLRLKAVLPVQGMDQPQVIHAVQHQSYPWQAVPQWPWSDQQGRLVVITQDLDFQELWARLQALDTAVRKTD